MLLALQTGSVGTLAANLAFVEGLGFDPFFRGLLSLLTGIVVLIGGTYLVIATNNGVRQGLLLSLAGLFGWLFLMGIVWTIYGIGWKGQAPTWSLVEINVDDEGDLDDGLLFSEIESAAVLVESTSDRGIPVGGLGSTSFATQTVLDRIDDPDNLARAQELLTGADIVAAIEDPDLAQDAALVASRDLDLGDWRYLVTSDAIRGEAQAAVDAFLVEEGVFEVGGYVASQFGAFIDDGKPVLKEDANVINRVVHTLNETLLNPTFERELIVVQVKGAVAQVSLPGLPPPVTTVDTDAPLISVIMKRDRGGPVPSLFSGLRFTPAMFTVFSGAVFALLAWNMHVRDQREAKIRAEAA